jgi:hypothetical protein
MSNIVLCLRADDIPTPLGSGHLATALQHIDATRRLARTAQADAVMAKQGTPEVPQSKQELQIGCLFWLLSWQDLQASSLPSSATALLAISRRLLAVSGKR